jgi:hypothetical protein
MLPPRPAVDGDCVLPDAPDALEPAPEAPLAPEVEPALDEPAPEFEPAPMLELEPLPIRAFFSTKLPLPPDVADEPAGLVLVDELELLLDPSARCRQPVAVTDPADSVAERPVL